MAFLGLYQSRQWMVDCISETSTVGREAEPRGSFEERYRGNVPGIDGDFW